MQLHREPIYQQLSRALRDLVRGGEFGVGDKFLTEREITARFDVSRATANKALANLVVEGVLEFRKGVGTFIRSDVLEYDMRSLVSFTDKAKAAGKKPSTKVLSFSEIAAGDAPEDVCSALRVEGEEALYFMERLRLASRTPVILERRYVVAKYCEGLTREKVAKSLYAVWAEEYGLDVSGAEETIRAVNMSAAESRHLKVVKGAAGLLVISTGIMSDDRPLWHERTLYRGDAYEFRARLGALCPVRPAAGRLRKG